MMQKLRKHPFLALGGYMVYYLLYFMLLEAWRRPVHVIRCALDVYIPFCRFAVVPYLMWFLWVPFLFLLFLRRAPEEFWRMFGAFALGTTLSLVTYTIMPTGLFLRAYHPEQDIFTRLVRLIYSMDSATNVCPSLHVFVTLLLALAVFDSGVLRWGWLRSLTIVMSTAICCSTVLLDQHSVVDVVMGALLSVAAYSWVRGLMLCGPQPRHWRRQRLKRYFGRA